MIERLLSVVAPHLCSHCGHIGVPFCENCKKNIIAQEFSVCVLCGRANPEGICTHHKADFNQAWVVGFRDGALQRLIGNFKFRNMKAASVELADLMHRRLPTLPADAVLVPIPTTPAHIRERGYDHMLLIARQLARLRRVPVMQVLVRGNTLTQHRANRRQRIKQVKTAFSVRGPLSPDLTYIILDDVVTTGSTIVQAATLLRGAGATKVWVAVTSRQPLD
jgi:ComF family protein